MSASDKHHIYTLTTPCANCPFRKDIKFYLSPERAQEIAQSLEDGSTFYCHQTVDYDGGDEDSGFDSTIGKRARACAGSLSTMENADRPNNIMRIGERLGFYDRTRLDPNAPVYGSLSEWVASHRPDVDAEYCGVTYDGDCSNPAGYRTAYGVTASLEAPSTTMECPSCERPACPSCTSAVEAPEGSQGGLLCKECAEDVEHEDDAVQPA